MKIRIGLAGVALAAAAYLGGCATAPSNTTELASADGSASGELICKRMPVMGSNFPKKVCSTAEEWEAFDTKTHESVDSFDSDRREGNTQGTFEGQ